ncbi:hypothetical protein F5Y09DRAFT_297624 [Xylaria sp. FL1042]|nr:hypothetical protein F5Y09DRAFT_297624 [Xylaria sp. FL1042]
MLTNPLGETGNSVVGTAYTPFDVLSPAYRAPGKLVSVVIELSRHVSRGSVNISVPTYH